ncbi:MAG: sugar transferase, partial [Aggregatilineales bacterium]
IGDMSLVGPRPPIPYEVEVYSQRHMMRLNTQPGITGLWQVTARSSVSFEEMVDLDVEYIRTQSFLGDLTILIKTVSVIFNHKGAR